MFLDKLLDNEDAVFTLDVLTAMDALYKFGASKNSEIMFRWQRLCLRSEAEWILPSVKSFITSQGRMKFVRPLYRALGASKIGRSLAIDTFRANENM